jgi:hypothetical protein
MNQHEKLFLALMIVFGCTSDTSQHQGVQLLFMWVFALLFIYADLFRKSGKGSETK